MPKELRIGLLGGTFDPVHLAHLAMAAHAESAFGLDGVLFVPSACPPHKLDAEITPAAHRLAMLRLALAGHPAWSVDTSEVDRGGVTYTVDTLADIGARHPGARLYFILGADSLRDLPGWRDVPGILARCEIVTVARPGVEDAGLAAALDRLPSGLAARLRAHCIAGGDLDISSTDIRRRVAAGIDISALVPPAVAAYIAAHRLYVKETGP